MGPGPGPNDPAGHRSDGMKRHAGRQRPPALVDLLESVARGVPLDASAPTVAFARVYEEEAVASPGLDADAFASVLLGAAAG